MQTISLKCCVKSPSSQGMDAISKHFTTCGKCYEHFFFLNDNTKSRTVSSVYSYIQKMNHCEAITLARYYTKKRIGTICLYDHSQSCVHTVKGLKAWYRLLAEVKCIFKMFVVQKVCFGCGVHNHVHGTGHTRHVKPVHST